MSFQSSIVYDRQNRVLAELFDEGRRTWVPLARISPHLLDAVIATEDGSFFQNEGVDPRRLVGALVQNTQGERRRGRRLDDHDAAGAQALSAARRTLQPLARPQGQRSPAGPGSHAALLQGRDPGAVSEPGLLWPSCLWTRSGGTHLFWQVGRRFDPRRGFAAGRPAPAACPARSLCQPRSRQEPPAHRA